MAIADTIVTLVILLAIFAIIYTRVKHQDLEDTWEELKAVVTPDVIE